MAPMDIGQGPSKRTLTIFYVALVTAAVIVVSLAISAGSGKQPEKAIAGGYDLPQPDACLGQKVDVKQSGQFVTLQNADDTLKGKLRMKKGHLTGDVDCVNGRSEPIDATAGDGTIEGEIGGRPLAAELKRDAPGAGRRRPLVPGSIDGEYRVAPRSDCLGGAFELEGHGGGYELVEKEEVLGELDYAKDGGKLSGEVKCKRTGESRALTGDATDRTITITLLPAGQKATAAGLPEGGEKFTATKIREAGHTFAAFFVSVAIVMLAARLLGGLAVRFGQPRVMGEVTAGILLGPTLLGRISPETQDLLFPKDIVPYIAVAANLGLIFYMFLVGMEIDPAQLKGRITQAAMISNGSVTFAMLLGIVVAVPLYGLVGPDKSFVGFALFMGVTMSITAFPVLARILVERRMVKRPLGAVALACAAMDDVTAWFLIALATAIAVAGDVGGVIKTITLALAFAAFMFLVVRRVLGRVSSAYDEAGRVPGIWIVAIFAGVLLASYATEIIGIALIFGAFIMGAIMPRHAGLTEDVTHRIEDFVVILLLPLFFAATGLRTNLFLLDRPELWLLTAALIAVAMTGKLFGASVFARLAGFRGKHPVVIGSLMNTRGLTELIVLTIALDKGVITEALFASLVIMALFTTFLTGPLLKLLDPNNELGAPVEEELEEARTRSMLEFPDVPVPEKSILLAPQARNGLDHLLALAEPLAQSEPPRELILARLVPPPFSAEFRGGLQSENRALAEAHKEVDEARFRLIERGIASRAVAFVSPDPGRDVSRLAESEEVDLVIADGQRPVLGEGLVGGDIGAVLQQAPCDVAVLIAREEQEVRPGPGRPIVVPFGGAEHDWAALELGAWIASQNNAPLKLLGAAGESEERTRVQRLLGDAGLLLQQVAGVVAEPVVTEPGREGIMEAAGDAGLLVLGLSVRWKEEGLGKTRSEIARASNIPVLFVRRGARPGALAPAGDVTRFSWSGAGMGGGYTPGAPIT